MRSAKVYTIVLFLSTVSMTGCATVGNMYETALMHMQKRNDLAGIRQDTREELAEQRKEAAQLAAERDLQAAKIDAEQKQMEMEFCKMNREAQRQALKRQVQDTLQSKVAFNVTQGIEVGELEVDVDALQELLKQREQQRQDDGPPRVPQRSDCGCDFKECGCAAGRQKRFCFDCRHKSCSSCQKGGKPDEDDCGGPAAMRQAMHAPRKPLRPAEIPMKLPVKLSFGMENPEVEEARIRRQPITGPGIPREAQVGGPCDERPWQKTSQSGAQDDTNSTLPPVPVVTPIIN